MSDNPAVAADPTILAEDKLLRQDTVQEPATAGDAVAMAPEPAVTNDRPVEDPDAATPDSALGPRTAEDARTQLAREHLRRNEIDVIYAAARQFNAAASDSRSIDELTLGLLWKSERPAGEPFKVELHGGDAGLGLLLGDLTLITANNRDTRAWRIDAAGQHQFGMKDIFEYQGGGDATPDEYYNLATARKRWASRLAQHAGWYRAVPFESADPQIGKALKSTGPPGVVQTYTNVELILTPDDTVGFLVAVAARFTNELWKLPSELERLGIVLDVSNTAEIPLVEPVLAYLCFLSRAPQAAATIEGMIFLKEFCEAAAPAALMLRDGPVYTLDDLIPLLNTWMPRLTDSSYFGILSTLRETVREDSTASTREDGSRTRPGISVLDDLVSHYGGGIIPAASQLDTTGRALLEELAEAWNDFAFRVVDEFAGKAPMALFYWGCQQSLDSEGKAIPPLFRSESKRFVDGRFLGTRGFGVMNYGKRYLKATENLPLGGSFKHKVPS